MSGRSELSKRIKELRGKLSQGKFAKTVGIPQPNISAYEAGKKVPGYKPLFELFLHAAIAGKTDLAHWFAGQTGTVSALLLADIIEGEKTRKARLTSREVFPHALARAAAREAAITLPALALPEWVAPTAGGPEYMLATDDFVFPFRRDDIILVSGSHAGDLSKLVGHEVIAFRPDHFSRAERTKLENRFAETMSPDEVRQRRARRQFPFLRTGVFVGRLVIDQTIGGMPAIEVRTKVGDMLLEYLPVRAGKADLTRERFTELQVLGEVVGYLPGRPGGLHRVGEPKK